jgi:hypothetical protein
LYQRQKTDTSLKRLALVFITAHKIGSKEASLAKNSIFLAGTPKRMIGRVGSLGSVNN